MLVEKEMKETNTEQQNSDQESFLIDFKGIELTLKTGVCIMHGVSGKFQPGRLCAIMGPSGAGKTTVMSLITGKAKKTGGQIFVNGVEVEGLSGFRKLVGFVPQEDVMIRECSVRDIVHFSASYRLSTSLTAEEIDDKVDKCVAELGMSHIQNSPIGDERTRGISGGQRKRVNIAIELVAEPKVLFLDEPTSGLDSTTATALCQTLKDIAMSRQMTIAAVVHQPSISAFYSFDDLLLLGKGGRVVYHGAIVDAVKYFSSIGFSLPDNCNPADYYMDVTQGAVPCSGKPDFDWRELFDLWEIHIEADKQAAARPSLVLKLENASTKEIIDMETKEPAAYHVKMVKNLLIESYAFVEKTVEDFVAETKAFFVSLYTKDPVRDTPGFVGQFINCFRRARRQLLNRGFSGIMSELALHLLAGLVIGSVAADLAFVGPLPMPTCMITTTSLYDTCIHAQLATYTNTGNFMCFAIMFTAIACAAPVFGNEQVNYWRECAAGLLSVPYFLAKWLSTLPMILLSAAFFWFSFYSSFNNTGTSGSQSFFIVLMLYWFGYGLGFFVSQVVDIKYSSMFGVILGLIFAVAFSGVNPDMAEVHGYAQSRQNFWSLSGPRWAIEAFFISSIRNYKHVPDGPWAGVPYQDTEYVLNDIGYYDDNYTKCLMCLLWTGVFWAMLGLLIMCNSYFEKKK